MIHVPREQPARTMAAAAMIPEAGELLGAGIATLAVTAVSATHLLYLLASVGACLAATTLAAVVGRRPSVRTRPTCSDAGRHNGPTVPS